MNKKQMFGFITISCCGILLMINSFVFITIQIIKDIFTFFGVLFGFVLFIVGIVGSINYVREKSRIDG